MYIGRPYCISQDILLRYTSYRLINAVFRHYHSTDFMFLDDVFEGGQNVSSLRLILLYIYSLIQYKQKRSPIGGGRVLSLDKGTDCGPTAGDLDFHEKRGL